MSPQAGYGCFMPATNAISPARRKRSAKPSRGRVAEKKKQVTGLIAALKKMKSSEETLEVLQDKQAMKAIRDYEGGKMKFHPLTALDEG